MALVLAAGARPAAVALGSSDEPDDGSASSRVLGVATAPRCRMSRCAGSGRSCPRARARARRRRRPRARSDRAPRRRTGRCDPRDRRPRGRARRVRCARRRSGGRRRCRGRRRVRPPGTAGAGGGAALAAAAGGSGARAAGGETVTRRGAGMWGVAERPASRSCRGAEMAAAGVCGPVVRFCTSAGPATAPPASTTTVPAFARAADAPTPPAPADSSAIPALSSPREPLASHVTSGSGATRRRRRSVVRARCTSWRAAPVLRPSSSAASSWLRPSIAIASSASRWRGGGAASPCSVCRTTARRASSSRARRRSAATLDLLVAVAGLAQQVQARVVRDPVPPGRSSRTSSPRRSPRQAATSVCWRASSARASGSTRRHARSSWRR